MSLMTIPTRRLSLRPFESGDGSAFFDYMSDPEVARYNSSPPLSLEQAQESVDKSVAALAQSPEGTLPSLFAITLRPKGELIGHCRLGAEPHRQPGVGSRHPGERTGVNWSRTGRAPISWA